MSHFGGRTRCNPARSIPLYPDALPAPVNRPTHNEIARLAYSYWEAGGRRGDNELENWLRAERELTRRNS